MTATERLQQAQQYQSETFSTLQLAADVLRDESEQIKRALENAEQAIRELKAKIFCLEYAGCTRVCTQWQGLHVCLLSKGHRGRHSCGGKNCGYRWKTFINQRDHYEQLLPAEGLAVEGK